MKLQIIAAVIAILQCASGVAAEGITVDSTAGRVAEIDVPTFSNPGSDQFALVINKFNDDSKWTPYIHYSLMQKGPENSFRLSLLQSSDRGPVAAVVELYKDGKSVLRRGLISGIPLGAVVEFSLSWDKNGTVEYSIMGQPPRTLEAAMSFDAARVHISSADGTFFPRRPNQSLQSGRSERR